MEKRFFSPEPRIFAHRGDSANYPENTLSAFKSAEALGADVIETDIRRTKDRHYVIFHDEKLERITNGTGKVSDFTLDELKHLDAGYHWSPDKSATPFRGKGITVLSLEEALRELPGSRFNIDLKEDDPSQAGDYCDLLRKLDAVDRVLTASEYTGNLKAVRSILPSMATSASRWEVIGVFFLYKTSFLFAKKRFSADALQVPEFFGTSKIASKGMISEVQSKDLRVHVWTINQEKDMSRIINAGADGIMSDDPALLKRVFESMQADSD